MIDHLQSQEVLDIKCLVCQLNLTADQCGSKCKIYQFLNLHISMQKVTHVAHGWNKARELSPYKERNE